jgi:hypothetical protein
MAGQIFEKNKTILVEPAWLKTFWERYKQKLKWRFLILIIAVPLGILGAIYHVRDRTIYWITGCIVVPLVILQLYDQIQYYRAARPMTAAKADEWKRKIRALADNTDMTEYDTTIDELCEDLGDVLLGQVVKELGKMPAGKRILSNAYKIVIDRLLKN